ncbi:ferredoxin reductase [Paraconexibacter algicola]|uniref:Stearoyl-CoA 9-desaturase n=1 Tax=Paraconexibacter algicola TaxID=2133960 RepID=A0A2T4UIM6_9ACTN|nr:ferredoxin reductase [Paraconexibacter algicola]PTL59091.1 stearoyl-CoA 9-desaturase [Paraconexibacter algicola]
MSLLSRAARLATAVTTPLLPEDYLQYVDPLWSTRELRGRVDAVLPETRDSATIWIRTRELPAHVPGQYVRVGVDVDGVRHWRTYSLTSPAPRRDRRIAITVKAIDDGVVSRHLVHGTRPGTIVRLAPPAGDFALPARLSATGGPLLFVTAGSGITPVMSMLRDLAARQRLRDVVHVHLAPSANDVIFGAELRRLHAQHDGLTVVEHHDDRDGLFDVARLDEHCPDWRARPAWACGPAGLLDALTARYEDAGVPDALHLERFRPVVPAAGATAAGGRVRFRRAGKEVDADGATPLLVAGESAGALLPSGCRMGICHTCVGALCSGSVVDLRTGELVTADPDQPDLIRTCISAAAGDVEIDL